MNTLKPVPRKRSDPDLDNYVFMGKQGAASRRRQSAGHSNGRSGGPVQALMRWVARLAGRANS